MLRLPYSEYTSIVSTAMWIHRINKKLNYERVKVIEVIYEKLQKDENSNSGLYLGTQQLLVEILSGEHKGKRVEASNSLGLYYNVHVKKGRTLVAFIDTEQDGKTIVSIYSYYRVPSLSFLY